jgi:hypothetical protein
VKLDAYRGLVNQTQQSGSSRNSYHGTSEERKVPFDSHLRDIRACSRATRRSTWTTPPWTRRSPAP